MEASTPGIPHRRPRRVAPGRYRVDDVARIHGDLATFITTLPAPPDPDQEGTTMTDTQHQHDHDATEEQAALPDLVGDLVLERRDQADGTPRLTTPSGAIVELTPAPDEEYWSYRVVLSTEQAVIGFPKFGTVGIGMAVEEDWNTNLPYNVDAPEKIAEHIAHNVGDDRITRERLVEAITLIREAAGDDRGRLCLRCREAGLVGTYREDSGVFDFGHFTEGHDAAYAAGEIADPAAPAGELPDVEVEEPIALTPQEISELAARDFEAEARDADDDGEKSS